MINCSVLSNVILCFCVCVFVWVSLDALAKSLESIFVFASAP